jgi:hypothetical protein
LPFLGLLAQLVEQVTLNHRVGGSSPSQPTPSNTEFTLRSMSIEFLLLGVIPTVSNEGATQNSTDPSSKEKLTREE